MKLAILSFRLLSALVLNFLVGSAIAFGTGWDPLATTAGLTATGFVMHMVQPQGALLNTINVANLISSFGSFYLNNGQNRENVLKAFQQERTFPGFAAKRFTNDSVYRTSTASITSVLQQFKKEWSPKGTPTFEPNEIRLRNWKIDVEYTPDEIKDMWLAFLADLSEGDRRNWPIVRYIWEELVMKQAAEEQEAADWAGVHAAPPGGSTPGSAIAIYDGLKKKVVDGLAGRMNEVLLTNDSTDPAKAVDAVEEFTDALPKHWRGKKVKILCSPQLELNYFRDRRNQFGDHTNYRGEAQNMAVDGRPNWVLVPFDGMGMTGTDDGTLIATPYNNVVDVQRTNSFNMDMDRTERKVRVFADGWSAVGFDVPEMVYAHLPAGSGSGSGS